MNSEHLGCPDQREDDSAKYWDKQGIRQSRYLPERIIAAILRRMTQLEIETLWVENALSVAFRFGETVRVNSSEHFGQTGRIVALYTLEPHPTYVIELPDGSSVVAVEPDLESAEK